MLIQQIVGNACLTLSSLTTAAVSIVLPTPPMPCELTRLFGAVTLVERLAHSNLISQIPELTLTLRVLVQINKLLYFIYIKKKFRFFETKKKFRK